MFAVYGVCKQHTLARAKKIVKATKEDGERVIRLSPDEWEQEVQKTAEELFNKSRPKKMSSLFECKAAAEQFKDMAVSSGQARIAIIKRKDHLRRNGDVVLNVRTKKPRVVWVDA